MCLLRSDYMVDKSMCCGNNPCEPRPELLLKLVEFNTIASSMGVLSEKVGKIQKHIMQKYADHLKV